MCCPLLTSSLAPLPAQLAASRVPSGLVMCLLVYSRILQTSLRQRRWDPCCLPTPIPHPSPRRSHILSTLASFPACGKRIPLPSSLRSPPTKLASSDSNYSNYSRQGQEWGCGSVGGGGRRGEGFEEHEHDQPLTLIGETRNVRVAGVKLMATTPTTTATTVTNNKNKGAYGGIRRKSLLSRAAVGRRTATDRVTTAHALTKVVRGHHDASANASFISC